MSEQDFRKRNYEICRMTVWQQARMIGLGIILCLFLDYLFYESLAALIFMSPFPVLFLHLCKKREIRKRKQELNLSFRDALISMSVSVQAGYSLENAVRAAARDLEQIYPPHSDIVEEFHYMESQIRLSVPASELFQDLGRRSGVEDIRNFAAVLAVCRRMGGDMSEVIQKCARMVTDKIDIYREIRTAVAAKKGEQNIMSLMPAGIIVYLKLASPGFLDRLYGNLFGICVMTVFLFIYGFAYYLGRRIVEIEP